MSEPGIGPNPLRGRRDWVGQTGTGPYPRQVVLTLPVPANQRSARGTGVSTLCGAVLKRGNSIFRHRGAGVVQT